MASKAVVKRVRAVLKQNQAEALALGAAIEARSRPTTKSNVADDTPPNLKKKSKRPGAFMNKKMRPIRLGEG